MALSFRHYDFPVKNTLQIISIALVLLLLNSTLAAETKTPKKLPLVVVASVRQDDTIEWVERRAVLKPRQLVKVLNEEPGRVIDIQRFVGEQVKAGDVLAQQDDGLVRAEWLKLKARKEQVLKEWKRFQILRQEGMVSTEAYGQAETQLKVATADEQMLAKRLAYMTITSPLTGVVSERLIEQGDVAERYRHLFSIMDDSLLRARLAVEADHLMYLSRESPVKVSPGSAVGPVYDARISRIMPALDERTHQGMIEVELLPGFRHLRAGQLVRVSLGLQSATYPVIPQIALRRDTEGSYVFRLQPDSRVERVSVRIGRYLVDRVEISEGLRPGDKVVIRGFSGLKAGQQVKVVDARP